MNGRILRGLAFALAVVLGLNLPAWAQPGVRSRWTVAAGSQSFVAFNYGATASDTTGSTNARAIQAALTAANSAGGGVVVIDRPGIYLVDASIKADTSTVNYTLNSALVIYSNTTLVLADGVTVKLADASNVYTLRNSGGGNTAAGGTTTANSNIAVVGGKWDFNYANQTADPRGQMYWKKHGMWFDYVNGLIVSDVEMVGALKFCVWQTNSTRIREARVYVHATNSDGIHTGGGCSDVVIRDSQFTCPDNATPIITNEGWFYTSLSNVYLDSPHGPTNRVSMLNNQYVNCPIAPVRLAGGTSTLGTDNIEDVLVDGCTGDSQSAYCVEIIDDTSGSPNITGAIVRNLVVRNCRFVSHNTAAGYTNGFVVSANSTGFRDITIQNCTNTDLGFGLKGLHDLSGGSNATAFIDGEVVTESGTGAKGYFRKEDSTNSIVYVYPYPGSAAFTGASTPTYTGATSGAVRYNSTSTAPTNVGQNLIQIGSRCTAAETVTVIGCVNKKAYNADIYINGATVANVVYSGCSTTLGPAGRVLQVAASSTVTNASISGCTITGPSTHSSDAIVRVDSTGALTSATVSGNSVTGLNYLITQFSATVVNINLSGNTLTGYGSSSAGVINNAVGSKTYLSGNGNQYTDIASGWWSQGAANTPTGAGYVRVNNPSLRFKGDVISVNYAAGFIYDVFYNNSTAATGGPPTWATMGVGPVYYDGANFQKYAR